jgi:dTDP-4-amino-4,6-dideoxygalactose transaminase
MLIPRNPPALSWREIIRAIISGRRRYQIKYFEQALANYLGIKNIILVSKGRLALYFILKSLLKETDELILPAFTCNVILGAIKFAGIKPVFADVDINTFNMQLKHVKEVVTSKTKAILLTHQFGLPSDIDEILEFAKSKGILVIEDAAPALGARYKGEMVSSFGDVGFFSFQDSKVISTFEGGAIVTRNDDLFREIKTTVDSLKNKMVSNGKIVLKTLFHKILLNFYVYPITYRLWQLISRQKYFGAEKLRLEVDLYSKPPVFTPFQAVLGLQQLKKIDEILRIRNDTAKLYSEELKDFKDIQLPFVPNDRTHTYSRYAILLEKMNKYKLHDALKKKGIDLGFTFSYICPQYFEQCNVNDYKNSLYIAQHVLNLPITMNKRLNRYIISRVKSLLSLDGEGFK